MNSETTLNAADILTTGELAERLRKKPSWVYERTRNRGRGRKPLPVLPMGGGHTRNKLFYWPDVCGWLTDDGKPEGRPN